MSISLHRVDATKLISSGPIVHLFDPDAADELRHGDYFKLAAKIAANEAQDLLRMDKCSSQTPTFPPLHRFEASWFLKSSTFIMATSAHILLAYGWMFRGEDGRTSDVPFVPPYRI
jgi:hypothetical protein